MQVWSADGSRLGRIVCANGADIGRALDGLRPGSAPALAELHAALAPTLPLLVRLRALEGEVVHGPVASPAITDETTPTPAILAHLAGLARAGGVWVPAPQTAASAHLILRALHPLLGHRVALLHGDDATRQALAARLSPATGPSRR